MAGVYIHIPFCKQACSYCDFHFSTLVKNKTEVIKSICKEIELRKDYLGTKELETIYFGGGTPSILSKNELTEIFTSLQKYFTRSKDAEITLECNPDDLTESKLSEIKESGINRLSIGLQSFDKDELRWMNRAHTAEQSIASVMMAQKAGFTNITIDLIYGSKFLSDEKWEETLKTAIDLNVQHISAYNLTIEEKTKLGRLEIKGKEARVDEEKSSRQFLRMIELLGENGFEHYEISNFAKPGFIAVHNSNYWKGEKYVGIGPSAHSYDGANRQWNIPNNNLYIKAISEEKSFFEIEQLTTENRFNEYVLTGLRTKWGCDLNYLEKNFENKFSAHFKNEIKKFIPEFITENNQKFTLTQKGKLMADKIAMELFV